MNHKDEKNIRIRFVHLTSFDEHRIRKFLQGGVLQKKLIPLTISSHDEGSEKRDDFRVAFPNSKITINPAGDADPGLKTDCRVINMSAGGFMIATGEFFHFRKGEMIEFSLNFLDPDKTFRGVIEGFNGH